MGEAPHDRLDKQEEADITSVLYFGRFVKELEEIWNEASGRGFTYTSNNGADVMVLTYITKQFDHLHSLRALVSAFAHRDALVIGRTMLEGLGRLAWAFKNQPGQTDQWLRYSDVFLWREMRSQEAAGLEINLEDLAELKERLDQHGSNYYRPNVRKRIREAESSCATYELPDDPWRNDWTEVDLRSMFVCIDMEYLYDLAYRHFSEWVHWGPRSLFMAAQPVEEGIAGFRSTDWSAAALSFFAAFISIHHTLEILNDHFSLGLEARLKQIYDNAERNLDNMPGWNTLTDLG